jgi:hypothetical protein
MITGVHVFIAERMNSTATLRPGLTMLFLGLAMSVGGGVLAFDLRGLATKIQQNGSEFTPWGRKYHSSQFKPNPARVVGWGFFVIGVLLLGEDLIAGVVHLAHHL